MRSQAAASAPIIGSLRSDVTGIIVTGVSQSVSDSTWWQIVQPTGNKAIGWVNARFLAPADSGAEPKTDFGLRCTGTEPFWSLEVAEGYARFEAPEGDRPSWKASRWRMPQAIDRGTASSSSSALRARTPWAGRRSRVPNNSVPMGCPIFGIRMN